ncbi:hypothetical protein ACJRO7_021023 [Eucalyptus globulus]|uniref:CMP/dCMP-type deaminase domain-containing protein n=1 Tax=Eucalyptus globulus TaxID=34317 RepID=A0ABD3KKD5_EUCGL
MEFPLLRVNDSLLRFVLGFVQLAKVALDSLKVPVGCLIVEEVHLTATGRNSTNETGNATRHGETEALDVFIEERTGFSSAEVAEKFSACSLYVTCESCIMCAAAKSIIGMKEVYYGCTNDIFGGCGSILSFYSCSSEVCNSPNLGNSSFQKCQEVKLKLFLPFPALFSFIFKINVTC